MRTALRVGVLLVLCGCAFAQDVVDTASLQGEGRRQLSEEAFVSCGGHEVMLLPDEDAFEDIVEEAGDDQRMPDTDLLTDEQRARVRTTTCSAETGYFFGGLPAGDWLLFTELVFVDGPDLRHLGVKRQISTVEHEVTHVTFEDNDFPTHDRPHVLHAVARSTRTRS